MHKLNRIFADKRGVIVRVIRWEPETNRVIYLRDGYEHGECFSPLDLFQRYFREIGADHELTSQSKTACHQP
ncbi:DUF4222 domain-containing protein [Pantoea sp. ICBG 1758]|uniref:DUF4222 domain-containing protein n=1 Tax=Pantoea sp. ICBG 1758 TaxID=2071682 RepID=UPI000CE3140F|nr:DUF4222 domain-containing protein [Pantoea sp. ICBG 1758]PPC64164.1 DUF4222 domain-containing protein [Pantoea sp. ICBG 1758]